MNIGKYNKEEIDKELEFMSSIYEMSKNKLRRKTMSWFLSNWDLCLLVFMILEKAVKASPSKYDDILLDMVWGGLKKMMGKK